MCGCVFYVGNGGYILLMLWLHIHVWVHIHTRFCFHMQVRIFNLPLSHMNLTLAVIICG